MIDPASVARPMHRYIAGGRTPINDQLAVEEPLEIRIGYGPRNDRHVKAVSITMRTPASDAAATEDFELAAGFLFTEGILHTRDQLERCFYCGPETSTLRLHNVVRVELAPPAPGAALDLDRLERHFYTTRSCGVCGKTSIDAVRTPGPAPLHDHVTVPPDIIHALPEFLRSAQAVVEPTGGLHAAALFDTHGRLVALREDVGRHNALDKLIGSQFLANCIPAHDRILLVSGRASFELVQKAAMAGIPILAAVGAPSSLAVDLARESNITLLGFVRENRFNAYTAEHRIA